MLIKELELENFKSFKHQKFIFNKGITAIIGPNGSGKSNIFDALLFVLGNNSSVKLRYKKISDLICKNQREKYATVRLTFTDNTIIERSVTEDSSVFRLNGKRTTQEAIISYLKELKISSEGHNLVQQGNSKKIVDMTEIERKHLIENIANVSLFDEQRKKSEKNLEFVKQKIAQAKVVLGERKTMLDTLEKEKTITEEYLKVKERESILKGIILKKEKLYLDKDLQKSKKRIETLNRIIPQNKSRINDIKKELSKFEKSMKLAKENLKKHSDLYSKLDSEYNLLNYKLSQNKQDLDDFNVNITKKNNRLSELKSAKESLDYKELKLIKTNLDKLKKELDQFDVLRIEKEQAKINAELKSIESKLSNKYSEYYEQKSKLSQKEKREEKEKQAKNKLDKIVEEISKLKSQIKDLNKKSLELSKLEANKNNLQNSVDVANKNIQKIQGDIQSKNYELESCRKELSILKNVTQINTNIIPINKESDADTFVKEAIKKNVFGTFYFALKTNIENIKSNIIIKTISPKTKIRFLEKKILDLEKQKSNLELDLKTQKANLIDLIKRQNHLKDLYDKSQKELYNIENNNKNILNKISYLENQKKDLLPKEEFILDFSHKDLERLEKEIQDLNNKKSRLVKVNFDSYFGLLKEYKEMQEKYNIKKERMRNKEIEMELKKKEALDLEKEIAEISEKAKQKKDLISGLEKEFSAFTEKKLNSERKLRESEKNLLSIEQNVKSLLEEKSNLNTKISLHEQEYQDLKNSLFLKEEKLKKKVDEIKKFIELNTNINTKNLEIAFSENVDVPINELQEEYYKVLNNLNTFGNINLRAIEDYKEYLKKYDTIFERINQLEKESDEIKAKIKEIQQEKEQKFMTTFDLINKNFTEILTKLGLGDLNLEIIKNDLDEISGVNIKSRKRGTISLSGGEKSLLTISFLFSTLVLDPSGFYLLDEIDADLDYNISEKVFNMLNDFAKDTQILLVTHNPTIINKAENVIGVSKSPSGVTTIFIKQQQKI